MAHMGPEAITALAGGVGGRGEGAGVGPVKQRLGQHPPELEAGRVRAKPLPVSGLCVTCACLALWTAEAVLPLAT